MSHICPVCGFIGLFSEPRSGGDYSYEICPCCGFQFGYTDASEGFTHEQWRQQWIAGGMIFDKGRTLPPSGWDPVAQLRGIGVVV